MRLDAIDALFRDALAGALARYYEMSSGDPELARIDWTPTYLISVFRTLIDLLQSLDYVE